MSIVDKHTPRTYSAIVHNQGIALCTDQDGAFTCIRFRQELERLKALLDEFNVEQLPTGET